MDDLFRDNPQLLEYFSKLSSVILLCVIAKWSFAHMPISHMRICWVLNFARPKSEPKSLILKSIQLQTLSVRRGCS